MKRTHILLAALLLAPLTALRAAAANMADGERMAAFREAKFGMFIHWGLYAIPARGEWVMCREKIPVATYAEFATRFNPVKFNADEWVRVAKNAGMRYIVITAKHHDGFAMFGTKASPYNIVDATPFKRDPLQELAAACRKEGIGLGFYYSQAQDWHHPGGGAMGASWDPVQKGDFEGYLEKIAAPQVKELLTGYGPVFAIWFDTPVRMTRPWVRKFVDLVHAVQPATLVNSRLLYSGQAINELNTGQLDELKGLGVDYLSYADRQIPKRPQWRDWETCMTLNHSWGFNERDNNWKSPEALIGQLIEIAGKGGNFLLNVGPTAEGEIPEPSVRNLKAVGEWLKVNGEAIYGSGPSPFSDESKKPVAQSKDGAAPTGESPAWRSTTKPGKLYIHLLRWPAGKQEWSGAVNKVTQAYLLAQRDMPLTFKQEAGHVTVQLPPQAPDPIATVLCLEHE